MTFWLLGLFSILQIISFNQLLIVVLVAAAAAAVAAPVLSPITCCRWSRKWRWLEARTLPVMTKSWLLTSTPLICHRWANRSRWTPTTSMICPPFWKRPGLPFLGSYFLSHPPFSHYYLLDFKPLMMVVMNGFYNFLKIIHRYQFGRKDFQRKRNENVSVCSFFNCLFDF